MGYNELRGVKMDQKKIQELWRQLIIEIGEDPDREGLADTPKRIARMYEELFVGYDKSKKPKLTYFTKNRKGGLLIDRGYFYSHCEHHIVPFFGQYYFGYIPDKLWIGASKIGRTIDYHSARLQIAETLCADILDEIEKAINPLGCILLMSGRHFCKEMRGLKKYDSPFEAIEARGCLLENSSGCKDEFLSRIGFRI